MEPEISKTEPRRPVSTHFSCFWLGSGLLTHVNCEQWTLWMSHIGTVDTVDVSYWHIGQCLCVEHTQSLWNTHIVSVAHTQCLCGTATMSLWHSHSVSLWNTHRAGVRAGGGRAGGGRFADNSDPPGVQSPPSPSHPSTHPKLLSCR